MPQQSAPPAAAFRLDADDGLHSGTNPFRNSGMDPGLNIGMNPGLCSRVNSGANPEINPVLNLAMNSGLRSSANSGLNSEANPGLNSGMSNAVRDKLQELEKEIEKFREENVALHRLREEREKVLKRCFHGDPPVQRRVGKTRFHYVAKKCHETIIELPSTCSQPLPL